MKSKNKSVFEILRQAKEDKRTDVEEGKLSKRENSAEQNGEDF